MKEGHFREIQVDGLKMTIEIEDEQPVREPVDSSRVVLINLIAWGLPLLIGVLDNLLRG